MMTTIDAIPSVPSQLEGTEGNIPKATISKSWSEFSSHAPSYGGGKVTLCHTRGTANLYGIEESAGDAESKDESGNSDLDKMDKSSTHLTPFILAPCAGDLTIIDAMRGIKVRTIREGCSTIVHGEKEEEDEDESLDIDAIVEYALAPNDCDLITAGRNNILRHYDISGSPSLSYMGNDGKGPAKVRKVIGRSGHELPISCIDFHCSGIFFATGSIDGNVKVWDLRGGYATHSFRYSTPGYTIGSRGGLRGSVTRLSWCPDITKLWLAVGRDDGTIRVHDLRIMQEDLEDIVELTDHVGPITSMVWASGKGQSKDYDTFFTAGRDQVVNTWAFKEVPREISASTVQKKKRKKKGITGEKKEGNKIVFKRIHTLPLYENVEALQLLPDFHHYFQKIKGGNVTRNDIVIATGGSKGVIRMWKTTRKESSSDELGSITGLVCIADQDELSSFGEKRGGYTGLLLTSHKHQLCQSRNENETDSNSLVIGSNAAELIAIDAEYNMSFLNLLGAMSNASTHNLLRLNRTIVGHNDEILDLKIIPQVDTKVDGNASLTHSKRVAVATNTSQIRLFDLSSYSCEVLDGHSDTVLTLDISPCGKFLASAGKDKIMRVWHCETKKCIAIATGHTEAIGAVALSRKVGRYDVVGKAAKNGGGSFIVTASKDKTLKRWNLPGSSVLEDIATTNLDMKLLTVSCSIRAHEKDINIVSIAPNDSLIATGSQDKTVKLWNATDLTLKGHLKGHKRGVWDCQFSSHDRVIATCSGDKSVKLWSLSDYSCVRTFQGHGSGTLRVRFLSGGLQLVSCDAEGIIRLWSIRSNECVFSMDAHDGKIWALDLSSDGKMLVTGAADSCLKVFKDTTIELDEQNRKLDEQSVLMEQQLANHLRFKEYEQALDIALDMDKPRQALKVLSAIVENDLSNGKNAMNTLQKHVKCWDDKRITQILMYCREWNTRGRNSQISMLAVKSIFSSKAADELSKINGLPAIIEGIVPYAERHFERIDKLHADSYLVDFTLVSMGDLDMIDDDEYSKWERSSCFVLPPKAIDGRVQIGGQTMVGFKEAQEENSIISEDSEVLTMGDSDSECNSADDSSVEQ
mmetsp:Transcript_2840/g.3333  ORF Transcript_2840/g.3333 Transcript_2840/m.3333 type:complete len:1088 (-) Transcript_2840:185-3448(-)